MNLYNRVEGARIKDIWHYILLIHTSYSYNNYCIVVELWVELIGSLLAYLELLDMLYQFRVEVL
jgi:hypothetical protein